jgi:hypothetical protein
MQEKFVSFAAKLCLERKPFVGLCNRFTGKERQRACLPLGNLTPMFISSFAISFFPLTT